MTKFVLSIVGFAVIALTMLLSVGVRADDLFKKGDLVCHKSGGPIGTVSERYITGSYGVRFYFEPKSDGIQIGVGGSLIGGDGISENKSRFTIISMYGHELLKESECKKRLSSK